MRLRRFPLTFSSIEHPAHVLTNAFLADRRDWFTCSPEFLGHYDSMPETRYAIAEDEGQIIAYLPFSLEPTGAVIHSRLTFSDIIGGSGRISEYEYEIAVGLLSQVKLVSGQSQIVWRSPPPHYVDGYPSLKLALSQARCELSSAQIGMSVQVQSAPRFSTLRRRMVKQAERRGFEVSEISSSELSRAYKFLVRMLDENRAARPVHSLAEFSRLHEFFPLNVRTFGCFGGGELGALVVCFYFGRVVKLQYIASSRENIFRGAIDLLIAQVLERERGKGRTILDLGTCNKPEDNSIDFGLIRFKEGFGAKAYWLNRYLLNV